MKLILCSIFFFLSFNILSQTGYLGKKYAIKVDGYFHPVFAEIINPEFKSKTMKPDLNFSLSKFCRKNVSIALDYHLYQGEMEHNGSSDGVEIHNISQHSIGMSLKKFNNEWMSPIGKYNMFSVMFNINKISKPVGEDTHFSVKLGYGYGYQRIIYNRFLIDIGAIGFISSEFIAADKDSDSNNADIRDEAEDKKKIAFHDLFFFKVGVGYVF
jgi:hypothetical protein